MRRYSFSRSHKLATREFSELFQAGSRYKTPCFIFIYQTAPASKLGVAIPKKHIAKAVQRNRLKRVIREQFRLQQHQWHLSITVCSRPHIRNADVSQIDRELQDGWHYLQNKDVSSATKS